MRKKLTIFFLSSLLCSICAARGTLGRELEEEKYLRDCVSFLCDSLCDGRASGTRGNAVAAFQIVREFSGASLKPMQTGSYSQSFALGRDSLYGHNIVGMLENSTKKHARSYIIVGAHYDALGSMDGSLYPGADSNASGVAALLCAARLMREQRAQGVCYASSIIFVCFDAFNMGRKGSLAFWDALRRGLLKDPTTGEAIRPSRIRLMIDLDQMGSSLCPLPSGRPDFLMAIGQGSIGAPLRGALQRSNARSDVSLELSDSYYGSTSFTQAFYRLGDRRIFIDNHIPTLYLTSGITDLTNCPADAPSSLDYPVLHRRTLLLYSFLAEAASLAQ